MMMLREGYRKNPVKILVFYNMVHYNATLLVLNRSFVNFYSALFLSLWFFMVLLAPFGSFIRTTCYFWFFLSFFLDFLSFFGFVGTVWHCSRLSWFQSEMRPSLSSSFSATTGTSLPSRSDNIWAVTSNNREITCVKNYVFHTRWTPLPSALSVSNGESVHRTLWRRWTCSPGCQSLPKLPGRSPGINFH